MVAGNRGGRPACQPIASPDLLVGALVDQVRLHGAGWLNVTPYKDVRGGHPNMLPFSGICCFQSAYVACSSHMLLVVGTWCL